MQGHSPCPHTTWAREVITLQNSTPFLYTCVQKRSAGQWLISGQEQCFFGAAPALCFKGSLTLLLWKHFRADAIPGLPKQRGIADIHTEGMGSFPIQQVYVAPPRLEACKLTPFALPLENSSGCTRFGLPGETTCCHRQPEYFY